MRRVPALVLSVVMAATATGFSVEPREPRKPQLPGEVKQSVAEPATPSHGEDTEERPSALPQTNPHEVADSSPSSITERIAAAWPGNDSKALRVTSCESDHVPTAYNPAGPFYGLWQFNLRTWRSVGGSGLPSEASVEEQTRRAWRLKQRRGWQPWPVCGKA